RFRVEDLARLLLELRGAPFEGVEPVAVGGLPGGQPLVESGDLVAQPFDLVDLQSHDPAEREDQQQREDPRPGQPPRLLALPPGRVPLGGRHEGGRWGDRPRVADRGFPTGVAAEIMPFAHLSTPSRRGLTDQSSAFAAAGLVRPVTTRAAPAY